MMIVLRNFTIIFSTVEGARNSSTSGCLNDSPIDPSETSETTSTLTLNLNLTIKSDGKSATILDSQQLSPLLYTDGTVFLILKLYFSKCHF